YFCEIFGNAASLDHEFGAEAARAVEQGRKQVAGLINCQPDEIIFTSGATEADNLALIGTVEQYAERGNHVITCVTEHKAVLDTCHFLERKGFQITYLPVDQFGLVNPADVRRAITSKTVLVSIMAANNEIGTIAPLAEIGTITRDHEVLFHTDAVQAGGHLPLDVEQMKIDLLSLSAHKMYGPKGIGALYVRKRRPRVKVAEQIHGGGHERGMRSGTSNVPGVVGFGKAAEIARQEMTIESERLRHLRDQLWEGLQAGIKNIQLNGHPTKRLPHNLCVAIPGIESRALLVQLKDTVALSTGSACTTAKVEPSHVILALGFGAERAHRSLRFGLGRKNSSSEVEWVAGRIVQLSQKLAQFTENSQFSSK
ncbi:MAG: cysteine desulfurase, partial [Blastocatellia bacterium]|nr:cysteine desulfurase [Blastocatellia bacterium]